jgi:hypothetical protein
VLAAIIHLGDIDFAVDDFNPHEGEKSKVINQNVLTTGKRIPRRI